MKRALILILAIVAIGILWKLDVQDRCQTKLPMYFSTEEQKFFTYYKTVEESQEVIRSNWGNDQFQFPREEIKTVRYYKNIPFISRLTSKRLTQNQIAELSSIINNPDNFHWGETTWSIPESHYFFRFFNVNDEEIGKLWVCYDKCGMTELRPWIPSTQYGGLSKAGLAALAALTSEL